MYQNTAFFYLSRRLESDIKGIKQTEEAVLLATVPRVNLVFQLLYK